MSSADESVFAWPSACNSLEAPGHLWGEIGRAHVRTSATPFASRRSSDLLDTTCASQLVLVNIFQAFHPIGVQELRGCCKRIALRRRTGQDERYEFGG